MAEVPDLRRFHQENLVSASPATIISHSTIAFEVEEEEEPLHNVDAFDSDSLFPPQFHPISEPEPDSQESESVQSDQDFFFYGPEDEEDDEMNFVTDLFATRNVISDDIEFGCRCMDEEPELVLGLESECNRVGSVSSSGGLRIVDMDSESDSEAVEIDSRADSVSNHDGVDPYDDSGLPEFWDCLQLDGQRERAAFDQEFEWEEVNVRENLSSLIDRIEEISVSSDGENLHFGSGGEEEEEEEENARNVEWQVLLAVNNLDLAIGFDEYNVLSGELLEAENSVKGSPPAAKSVLENLPSVALTMEDLAAHNVACAVCKDEICIGVEVIRLPCYHHYHEDCIFPWLSIRNTCPLCRYELPTDDVDYERRKNGNGGGTGLIDDSQLRYNYQLLP